MNYHSYQHVERYDREEFSSFVEATDIYIFPKLDGTAGVITAEPDGQVYCGSRNRLLAIGDDNQGFAEWVFNSDDPEAQALKDFCVHNPKLHIHGEWLGTKRCLGSIKDYLKTGFWVYDVFSEDGYYLSYGEYAPMLDSYGVKNVITPMKVLAFFDKEKIISTAEENHFLLPDDVVGEGVVLKSYGWRDKYGRQQFLKLVLEEFKENKGKKKVVDKDNSGVEQLIVDDFVTTSDVMKAYNKVLLMANSDSPKHKIIGITMNMVMDDLMKEEITEILRKYKYPKIDFALLKNLVNTKVRLLLI